MFSILDAQIEKMNKTNVLPQNSTSFTGAEIAAISKYERDPNQSESADEQMGYGDQTQYVSFVDGQNVH